MSRRRAALIGALIGAAAATLLTAPAAAATQDPATAALCDRAVAEAARRHRVPERLLRALSHVETGRTFAGARRAWPWTVNAAGDGRWFATRSEAAAFARAKRASGVRSIDLGCLQINAIWHGDAFNGLDQMLDPRANADYAARYLAQLRAETGDWMRAAGYYHSRTKVHFERYSALVQTAYAALGAAPAPNAPPVRSSPRRPQPRIETAALSPALFDGLLRRARAGASLPAPASPLLVLGETRARQAVAVDPAAKTTLQTTVATASEPRPKSAAPRPGRRGAGGVALDFAGSGRGLLRGAAAPLGRESGENWLKP